MNGQVQDLDGLTKESYEQSAYQDRVIGLLPLLREKEFTLTALGEGKIDGKPTVGVKVVCKGKPDVTLHFDKDSGLLVRAAYKMKMPGFDKEVAQEIAYTDYREVGGSASEERLLTAAGLKTDGAALLKYLRDQAPDPKRLERVKDLIRKLGDDSFTVREEAGKELIGIGKPAIPQLQAALKDADLEIARRAEELLSKIGEQTSNKTAIAVVRLLAQRRPEGAVEALLDYLPGADRETVIEVISTLALLGQSDGKPHPALAKALDGKDNQRRQAALMALGKDDGKFLSQPGRRLNRVGIKLSMKQIHYQDGKDQGTMEILEVQSFNRFDDQVFTRPGK
jgi:hypothetical protein